jgi:TolB-like protein/DNA-binding winged helix-turn-helix (wHTH) protein
MSTVPQIQVDLATERLWRDGACVPVTRKVFRLLRTFVRHSGELLTTEALLAEVWPDTHVAEGSVKDCVKQLRALLNDDASNPRFIETIRGRGYIYRGGIALVSEGETPPPSPERPMGEDPAPGARGLFRWSIYSRRPAAPASLAAFVILVVLVITGLRAGITGLDSPSIGRGTAPETDRLAAPTVAISPFVPLSEGRKAELVAGAFTTGVASALSRAPDLIVVRGPAAEDHAKASGGYSGPAITHVLSGAVQMDDHAIRLTAMLEDVVSGHFLWSERYNLELDEVLALQDKVVQQVFSELRVHLVEGDRARIGAQDTETLDAWLLSHEAYGEYLKFDRAANLRARELWSRATALDPGYATPVAGLALTHWADAKWGWTNSDAESLLTAKELAERTIAINPDEPLGHQALGTILFQQGRPGEAIVHRRTAMDLAPNDISVVAGLAIRLNEYGRYKEALPLFERSLRLSPRPPWWVYAGYGIALHLDDRPEEAVHAYEFALARGSARPDVHARLAAAYADIGDAQSALRSTIRALELSPEFSIEAFVKSDGFQSDELNLWLADLMSKAGLPE